MALQSRRAAPYFDVFPLRLTPMCSLMSETKELRMLTLTKRGVLRSSRPIGLASLPAPNATIAPRSPEVGTGSGYQAALLSRLAVLIALPVPTQLTRTCV